MKAVAVCALVLALGSAPGAQDQAKIDQAIRKASGEGIADELPPLSEARAAGRLKSMYLLQDSLRHVPRPRKAER
jgi:hypothetical protein